MLSVSYWGLASAGSLFLFDKWNKVVYNPLMDNNNTTTDRPLFAIAHEVRENWEPINYGAVPYLDAMTSLVSIKDDYGHDKGDMIVRYFLSNATSWRGPMARKIKAELKSMLG